MSMSTNEKEMGKSSFQLKKMEKQSQVEITSIHPRRGRRSMLINTCLVGSDLIVFL